MTPRRLLVLIRGLPYESILWTQVREAEAKALKPTAEQIRARQAHYDRQREMSKTQQLEHEMGIAGHEPDCPHCQQEEVPDD